MEKYRFTHQRFNIELFLNPTRMDVFATSETNVLKNTPKTVFGIPNYRFHHEGGIGNKGGSGIYVKKEIPSKYTRVFRPRACSGL